MSPEIVSHTLQLLQRIYNGNKKETNIVIKKYCDDYINIFFINIIFLPPLSSSHDDGDGDNDGDDDDEGDYDEGSDVGDGYDGDDGDHIYVCIS